MSKENISPKRLRELLNYDEGSGKLFWLPRPLDTFASEAAGKQWNVKYAGKEAFTSDNGDGYKNGSISYKVYKAHRVIFAMITGEWPACDIDHINGDRSDNRITNLRKATRMENCHNRKRMVKGKSGIKGVQKTRYNTWQSGIAINGERIHIGTFACIAKAVKARLDAEAKYYGNYARSK